MRRWYDTEKEAVEAARNGGWRVWRVERLRKVRRGQVWVYEKTPSPITYYVWRDLPLSLCASNYQTQELSKDRNADAH